MVLNGDVLADINLSEFISKYLASRMQEQYNVSRETMITETKQLGASGEKIAANYLKKQGYKILDRNFRYRGYGELDIIAEKSGTLVFVEVKTRIKSVIDSNYAPEDNITYFKQKQLIKLAKIYLVKNNVSIDTSWQIDIIAIEIPQYSAEKLNLRHIEQAIDDIY